MFCLTAVFALACCYASLREPTPPPTPPWLEEAAFTGQDGSGPLKPPGPFAVTARVAEATPLPGNRMRVVLTDLRPAEGPGAPYAGRVVWNWHAPPAQALAPGDIVTAPLRLTAQHGMRNPGVWDTDRYWHDRGIWFRALAQSKAEVRVEDGDARRGIFVDAARLRQKLGAEFRANLPGAQDGSPAPGSAAGLLPALIFGDRSLLTPRLSDQFARATLAHSLALSGMHLGFAVMAGFVAAWLFGRAWPGFWLRVTRSFAALLFSLPFAGLYLWLGGAPVSLMRAACMLLFWVALALLQRPRVLLDGLCAAVALLLLLDPASLHDISLQLSALSVASIALALPMVHAFASRLFPGHEENTRAKGKKRLFIRRMAKSGLILIGLSFVIQLAVLPLTARTFGASGVLFPLNLVWLPVLGAVVLPFAFAGLGLTALGLNGPASFLLHAATLPCEGLLELLARLDTAGWLVSPLLPRPHWLSMAGYWLLCLALPPLAAGLSRAGRRRAWGSRHGMASPAWLPVAVTGFAMLISPPLWAFAAGMRDHVTVTMLDVGQGQAVLAEWGGTRPGRLLVDGGGFASPFFDVGKAVVAPALTDNAPPRLDAVIASHPDTDHLGGLLFILERFSVGRYFGNGMDAKPSLEARERAALRDRGLNRITLRAGDALALAPDLVLEAVWPEAGARNAGQKKGPEQAGGNDQSLMLRLIWKGKPLALLCGDAEKQSLEALLRRGADLAAPVLVLPHHGSAGSLAPGFYEAVNPQIALASCGFGNRWGFPAPEVRHALKERGIPLLSTAFSGQIRVEWNAPDSFRIFTARDGGQAEQKDAMTK